MESGSGDTRSITAELHSSEFQSDQMELGSGVTQSIIHELHSWDI